jgi:hypothetical protein
VLAEGGLSSKIVNDQIVFTYISINDEDSSGVTFGSTNLRVKFPGDIDRIESNNSSLVTQINKRTIRIRGLATDNYDIKVFSSCGKKCIDIGSTDQQDPNNIGFAKAKKQMGGMITQNTVFNRANSPYTINNTLQIPLGLTVKVEPGVTIVSKAKTMFRVQGDLIFEGEESQPINLNGRPEVFFDTKGSGKGRMISLNYVNLNGGGVINTGPGRIGWQVRNSRIIGVLQGWGVFYPSSFLVEKSVFRNSGGIGISFSTSFPSGGRSSSQAIIRNNLFDGPSKSGFWVLASASAGAPIQVTGNHFKGDGFNILRIKFRSFIDASGNYWGTTNPKKIEDKVLDAADDSLKYKTKIELGRPLSSRPAEVPRK